MRYYITKCACKAIQVNNLSQNVQLTNNEHKHETSNMYIAH